MTAQQETRIRKLEALLQKSEKVLTRIATDSFIYGEKFCECMWCKHDVQDEHYENCLALQALEIRLDIERVLIRHHIRSGA